MANSFTIPRAGKVYRMTVISSSHLGGEVADPERPSWAETNRVFLYDHPETRVGHLTRHFYSETVSLNQELPSWSYNTLQHYADLSSEDGTPFDTDNWTSPAGNNNEFPPMDGPVPNTQGVYFGQPIALDKTWTLLWNIPDFDVLRFWPVGRHNVQGGLEAFVIGDPDEEETRVDLGIADAMTVIEVGKANLNNDSLPHTFLYKDAYLNYRIDWPKTLPSYIDLSIIDFEPELYPVIPELGPWPEGGREIGIDEWDWGEAKDITTTYAHFTNWYQNESISSSPGKEDNPKIWSTRIMEEPSYGSVGRPTEELTARQAGSPDGGPGNGPTTNLTGLHLTLESGIEHGLGVYLNPGEGDNWNSAGEEDGRKLLLADEMWHSSSNYFVGGFWIENRGLAYHMRNAVKWWAIGGSEGMSQQPFVGNLVDPLLYNGYGNIIDGNYGPMPPLMNFVGAGASWNSSIKNTAPYSYYDDWSVESGLLEEYYSNTSEVLLCNFDDYDISPVWVAKPEHITVWDKYNERVCPEYTVGSSLLVQKLTSSIYRGGREVEFIDLNAEARQIINYKDKGTLYPYYDYFPDVYIPLETEFLLPIGQTIPSYSFNCSEFTYSTGHDSDEPPVFLGVHGGDGGGGEQGEGGSNPYSKGWKGLKGTSGNWGDLGQVAQKGVSGDDGDGGGAGGIGGTGPGGDQGDKGAKGGGGPGGAAGEKGADGPGGEVGQKGIQGNQGGQGGSPVGDKGQQGWGLTSGNWGAVNSQKHNYTTASAGWIDIPLGDAATNAGNEATTIRFTKMHFGVCVEDSDAKPEYKSVYVYASDFID